jgi:hypothetical protein
LKHRGFTPDIITFVERGEQEARNVFSSQKALIDEKYVYGKMKRKIFVQRMI